MRRNRLILGGMLAAAAGWKTWLLARGAFPFNADEAIVALMGRHILAGARPTFFYGQAYMGSLDAYLVAAGFALFGTAVWVVRLVQTLLYLGILLSTYAIGARILRSERLGLLAVGLLVFPVVNLTLYTTVSLGGYGEALLIGNLLIWMGLILVERLKEQSERLDTRDTALGAAWGLTAGLGVWANGLSLVYAAPVGLAILIFSLRARVGWARRGLLWGALVVGGLLGAAPFWGYGMANGWQSLVGELLGSAVAVEGGSWLVRSFNHLVRLILLGGTATLGFRPPWEVRWLLLPLMPAIFIFWACVLGYGFKQAQGKNPQAWVWRVLAGVGLTLAAGFIFTSFGIDPSGRYFAPFSILLALAGGGLLDWLYQRRRGWALAVLAVVLAYQWGGTLDCALRKPPALTTQFDLQTVIEDGYQDDLIAFLEEKGETRGYSTYWVSYSLAFLSEERLIFIPRLPYHHDMRYTTRDDRYAPYQEWVEESETIAYITASNPNLDVWLRGGFEGLGVEWREEEIGPYRVFYALSRAVRPAEVGLGETRGAVEPE